MPNLSMHQTDISLHQNHLEGLLKHRILDPTLTVSDSVDLGGVLEFTFLTSSQVKLRLLVWAMLRKPPDHT